MKHGFRRAKRIISLIIFIAMTNPLFSQKYPTSDILQTSAGDVEMHFIGHGSLMFRFNEYVIHIDPVSSSGNYTGLPKADLILVTHEHYDHLDTDLIASLRKEGSVLLTTEKVAGQVGWGKVLKAGDRTMENGITIETVPAYNIVHMRVQGQPFHPKGNGIGFILTFGNKKIYVAGDTENTPEMKALKNINVAFLPMNLPYTMTPEMVADAVKVFKPEILYPYHFSESNTDRIIDLLKNSNILVRIRNLK